MALTKRVYVDGETIITAQNLNDIQDEIISHGNTLVPKTRTVNNKALSTNITLSAADVDAAPSNITEHFKWVSFVNTSSITTQIDALNAAGAYFGNVSYASATGLPENLSGIIYAYCYGTNYKRIYYAPIASADKLYIIEKKAGTWQSWVQLPTASDITPVSVTVTAQTGVTLANTKVFTIGKLAVVSFSLTNASSIASATNLVTGMPKPSSLTWINAFNTTPAIHALYVNSGGQLRPSGSMPAGDWVVTATYIADL